MRKSRKSSIGPTFTVVVIESRLKEFESWDGSTNNNNNNNNNNNKTLNDPLFDSRDSLHELSASNKCIGSLNELAVRRGDIIKVVAACNPDGSCRRKIPRVAKRLDSGFLDAEVPIHDPYDLNTWWIGTIVKRNKKDSRRLTGRFPQRCVALMNELRAKNSTFRCKMCSRMMQNYTANSILNDFGITGQKNHLFGENDLCNGCGPKILRVVKQVAQSVLNLNSNEEVVSMLQTIARKKLIHETAVEAYALTPERVPKAPPARRPEVSQASPSPRANKGNVRATNSPPPVSISNINNNNDKNNNNNNNMPSSSFGGKSSSTQSEIINGRDEKEQAAIKIQASARAKKDRERVEAIKRRKRSAIKIQASARAKKDRERVEAMKRRKQLESSPEGKAILPGLAVIFKNACAREGHLTKEHLVRMVQRLAKDHKEAKDFSCDLQIAEVIIDALDKDGNGTVEYDEWSEWIVRGAMITSKDREKFKKQNDMLRGTMSFLEAIVEIATKISLRPDIESLRPALVSIFEDAMQSDVNGHLFAEDIIALNKKLAKQYPNINFIKCNENVAATIVQSLDNDQNGSLEMDEFVPWIMSGISKTKEQRNNFSSQGETFQMLVQFMESLAQVAKEIRNGVNNLKPGLTKLFNKYSYDGVSMTSNDIFNMVTELSNQYGAYDDFTEDTADFIIQALDVDFNGTIEVDEWSDWIMRGAAKSVYARKRFSQTNQAFQNLGYFLDYIVVVAKQISPPEEGGNDDDDTLRKSDVVEAKSSVPKVNSILQQQRDRIRKNEVLKTKVSAFASLSDDHLNSIIDTMTFEEHDDDNPLIIEQGKVADRLYVVLAGEVSIMAATGTEGWPTEKCRIGELEVFGNEALLMIDNLRYSISGVACDDVQLLCLTIANNPMFGDKAQEIVEASRKQRAADITKRVGKQLAMKFRASRK